MSDIAGIPYAIAEFDQDAKSVGAPPDVPAGTTDVIIISHGWNNNRADAELLYRTLFTNFAAVAPAASLGGRKVAIVGVIWPSQKFDELIAVAGKNTPAGGAASLGDGTDPEGEAKIKAGLERLKTLFPKATATIDQAEALVSRLEEDPQARKDFVNAIRGLLDRSAANDEDASDAFFAADPEALFKRLAVPVNALQGELAEHRPAASLDATDDAPRPARGGAAGFIDIFSKIGSAATNLLNFTTYFTMKARAGNVGKKGVAPLVDALAAKVERVHLVGHSFGGRVVTAAAAASTTKKLRTLMLLQAAFSHNGFSPTWPGFFKSVGADHRVDGPVLITYTHNDKAVGLAYPLASRINGDNAAAFGDENDQFGGIGRNGAQQMAQGDVVAGKLLAVNGAYSLQPGKFHNLEASDFVSGHGDITGCEVAWALSRAVLR
jgi:hypothetical protein